MNQNPAPPTDETRLLKAKSDALRLLSFRPRSVSELERRLLAKKFDAGTVREVVESLKRQGLLDDDKFARDFLESRVAGRPKGRSELARELARSGVSSAAAAKALAGLAGYDEKGAAMRLAEKKFSSLKGLPQRTQKARLYGFLMRRGFGSDAVFAVMKALFREAPISDES